MASLAVTMIETKSIFWEKLSDEEQKNIFQWLNQINQVAVHPNNWRFFRVLVNVAFHKLDLPVNQQQLAADLKLLNSMSLRDGWYFDGNPAQMDYYVPWAMHFYGLLYAKYMKEEEPHQANLFIKRAKEFAQSFKYWFDEHGAAVPFGRSLTYRFAEAAFWSACVFTNTEVLPWGKLKTLIFKHLNYWRSLPIQKSDGVLSIGYGYENLYMSEHYNGPGSPYWAFKTFILLGTPKNHPFWQAQAVQPERQEKVKITAAKMILTNQSGTNVLLYPSAQYTGQAHADEKYSKFVYSSQYGFSVSTGKRGLADGAFDNVLAVAEAGTDYYFQKGPDFTASVTDNLIIHNWRPLPGADISSYIIPLGLWHIRFQIVRTKRELQIADGGFASPVSNSHPEDHQPINLSAGLAFQSTMGIVATINLKGFSEVKQVFPSPNSNLLFPNTTILTAIGSVAIGKKILISAHFAGDQLPTEYPQVAMAENSVTASLGQHQVIQFNIID